jgi:hypothetical protein
LAEALTTYSPTTLLPLALVPLDSRPCNYRFPRQIAAIGGEQLWLPPHEWLGDLHAPGRAADLKNWLLKLPEISGLIVSIDMLAYGGLVFSRRSTTSHDEALGVLEALKAFRAQRPSTPIYAFNILMRLAITMDSEAAAPNYYNVMRYARLADEAERFHSEYLREQLEEVRAAIPPAVLSEYLNARRRNHQINLEMVDWLADGVFDYLLITQEDAAEFGLHRREQDEIFERAQERNVTEKMSLHPGADEAALTLLARHWDTGVSLRVHWSNGEDAHRIALFEDRPFDRALREHVASMKGVLIEAGDGIASDDADFQFFVNAPLGIWPKDETDEMKKARADKLYPFVRGIEKAVEENRRVALCDVALPNGADDVLMNLLDKRGLLGKLAAYGGWNTAGNTLGTVLAQCAAIKKDEGARMKDESGDLISSLIPHPSSLLNRQFIFERLVDDWFYQSRVRAHIEKTAREAGASPLDLNGDGEIVEAQARRELKTYAQILASRHFGSTLARCDVALPWRRTFEVDLRAELEPVQPPAKTALDS